MRRCPIHDRGGRKVVFVPLTAGSFVDILLDAAPIFRRAGWKVRALSFPSSPTVIGLPANKSLVSVIAHEIGLRVRAIW